jgi:hypothetical protein
LRQVGTGSPESLVLAKELRIYGARMSTSARQCRLTVQHAIGPESGRLNERAPATMAKRASRILLGGHALQ